MGPPRRLEIKKIEDLSSRQVTFSKRRKGLFHKAKKWSSLYDAEVAVIVFSNTGKLYEFSSTRMDHIFSRYNNEGAGFPIESPEKHQHEPAAKHEPSSCGTLSAIVLLQEQIASLNSDCLRMMGKELDGLSLKELDELEKQLNQGILSVTKRKDELLWEEFYRSKSQEQQTMEMPSFILEYNSNPLDRLFYASSSNDISGCSSESERSDQHIDLSLHL